MKNKKWTFVAIICLVYILACSSLPHGHAHTQSDSYTSNHVHVPGHQHDYPKTFSNPPGSIEESFSWESLWFFPSRPFAQLFDRDVPEDFVIEPALAKTQFNEAKGKNSVTWIGHMSTLLRLDDKVILLDP